MVLVEMTLIQVIYIFSVPGTPVKETSHLPKDHNLHNPWKPKQETTILNHMRDNLFQTKVSITIDQQRGFKST